MINATPDLAFLHDPRFAPHATSAAPVWLWSLDGTRILWANAVGAAIFAAPTPAALAGRRFGPDHPAAKQIARLTAALPENGPPRLERLRGFGAGWARPLLCRCARLSPDVAGGPAGLLVVALEPARPALPLPERVRYLLGEHEAGDATAIAAFGPDGTLLHATPAGRARLAGASDLAAVGAQAIAAQASAAGAATGATSLGAVTITRIGADTAAVLLMTFPADTQAVAAAPESRPRSPLDDTDRSETAPPASETAAAAACEEATVPDRHHPLRFIWQMDADGRFTLGSDEFSHVIGPRTAAALGRSWADFAAELALDPDGAVLRAVATRDTWSGITVLWPVDGSTERLKVELSGLPIYDRNRNFIGYRGFGVCRDSERIAALAAMRRPFPLPRDPQTPPQSAPKSDLAPEGPTSASPAAEPERAAGERPALTLVPKAKNVVPFPTAGAAELKSPTLSAVERNAFHELARELSARLKREVDHRPADGDMPPAQESVATTAEPAPAQTASAERARPVGLAPPVDHDADAEENPAGAGRERALLDHIPVGILVYRLDRLLYANPAFLAWAGYDRLEDLAEAGGLDALFIEPGGHEPGEDTALGQELVLAGARGARANGRLLSIAWNGEAALALMVMTDAAGTAAGEKPAAAEARVRELGAALEQTEAALRAAKQEAEKAAAARAAFLVKISHDIRTPLTSIIGFSEVMLDERFGPIGNERYREYLQDIREAGNHVLLLLNDLLDLSKIEAGKFDLSFADTELNGVVQNCVALMQPLAHQERIIIRTSLCPTLPPVLADARAMRQIVLILLSNAVRLTGTGGQIIVSTAPSNGGVVLRVRNTGIGLGQNEVAAVLEPFQSAATAARWGSGPGIGLPLAKALAEANQAAFAIAGKVDDGALVEISFPPARVLAG
jgi:signal transduction histidine kinase